MTTKEIIDEEVSTNEVIKETPARLRKIKKFFRWTVFVIVVGLLGWYYTINPGIYQTTGRYIKSFAVGTYNLGSKLFGGSSTPAVISSVDTSIVPEIEIPVELTGAENTGDILSGGEIAGNEAVQTSEPVLSNDTGIDAIATSEIIQTTTDDQGNSTEGKLKLPLTITLGDYEIEIITVPEGKTLSFNTSGFQLNIRNK